MGDPGYYFFPGDYQRDTAHLTLVEDGAYRRLLDHYYSTGNALPDDAGLLCRVARAFTDTEQDAVRSVMQKFFTLNGDGLLHNKRADAELEKRRHFIALQKEKSVLGVQARQAAAKHTTRRSTRGSTTGSAAGSTRGTTRRSTLPYPYPYPSPVPENERTMKGEGGTGGLIPRARHVALTEKEFTELKAKHGEKVLLWCIEKLDAHKQATGTMYKSDAAAIRSWVLTAWEEYARKSGQADKGQDADGFNPYSSGCRTCGKMYKVTKQYRVAGICPDCATRAQTKGGAPEDEPDQPAVGLR